MALTVSVVKYNNLVQYRYAQILYKMVKIFRDISNIIE